MTVGRVVRLADIVQDLGGRLHGSPETLISRLAPLETADSDSLTFVVGLKYRSALESSRAGAYILSQEMLPYVGDGRPCIETAQPYLYFARLTQWWKRRFTLAPAPRVHPLASIDPSAICGQAVDIGPFAVVEAGAVLGDGVRIGAHTVVAAGARVGQGSHLHAHVVVAAGCQVGQRCVVHSGAVIGADGFGFAQDAGVWVKIEQLGAVRIGDDVEIGANTCIDRGALGDTVIGDGVKLDNLIQIGHNVQVGPHTAMAGCVGVAGSARIGAHCTIGGGAVVLGHLSLADHVHVSAASVVTRSIGRPGHYSGVFPIDDNANWEKNAATLKQLHRLRDRVRHIEKSRDDGHSPNPQTTAPPLSDSAG